LKFYIFFNEYSDFSDWYVEIDKAKNQDEAMKLMVENDFGDTLIDNWYIKTEREGEKILEKNSDLKLIRVLTGSEEDPET
jgi:hypothetical protein